MCVLVKGNKRGKKKDGVFSFVCCWKFSSSVFNSVLSVHKRTYMHMSSIDKRSVEERRRAGSVFVFLRAEKLLCAAAATETYVCWFIKRNKPLLEYGGGL